MNKKSRYEIANAWRFSLLGVAAIMVCMTSAFASSNDCKNPVDVPLNKTVKMKFCEIPAGNALIGSEDGEADEKPVKMRSFKSFQMGMYTVTQAQFRALIGEVPWKYKDYISVDRFMEFNYSPEYVKDGDNLPAVYIHYIIAQQFVRAMNLVDRTAEYRLPTEAEFEYATRAGTTTKYYWGNEANPDYAYYWKSTGGQAQNVLSCPNKERDKKEPGYCANNFGLMHMSGNVWQWTEDAYGSYESAPSDGNVPAKKNRDSYRVLRGGNFADFNGETLRSANRFQHHPGGLGAPASLYDLGLRLVRIPKAH